MPNAHQVAAEALVAGIGGGYEIEKAIGGRAEERRTVRQARAGPLLGDIEKLVQGDPGAGVGEVGPGDRDPLCAGALDGTGSLP